MPTNDFRPLSLYANGKKVADGLRIRIRGSGNMTLLPDLFLVDVYNLSDFDLYTITEAGRLMATSDYGITICSGEIEDIYTRQEQVNIVTTFALSDGKSFWGRRISETLGGGSWVKDTIRHIIKDAEFGGFYAEDKRLYRGQTYTGRMAEGVSMLAKSVGARAFITLGVVYVVTTGRAAAVVTVKDEDIIDEGTASDGILTVKLRMQGYPIGALVNLRGATYRLLSQKTDADNLKGDWNTSLILADETLITRMEGG